MDIMPKPFYLREEIKASDYIDFDTSRIRHFPSEFLEVEGQRIVYEAAEQISAPYSRFVNVPGVVVSGPYKVGQARVVDVEPITNPQLRSKVTEMLQNMGSVDFWSK